MKQTAVEWLVEKLSYTTSDGTIISHHFIINKLVEQAKEMEKGQIIEAHSDGRRRQVDNSEQYYNETFKTNKMKEKEEPKQETHICKYCNAETTQSDDECYAKHKQETLEEAAQKRAISGLFKDKALFIAGAKWQAERSYSEEEVLKLVDGAFHMYASSHRHDAKAWLIEQFKKK